jgi:hypothetical protein
MTVKNMNTLKAMERKGLIELHRQTGSKIAGLYSNQKFTCYYVHDGLTQFQYKKQWYGIKYFSGCFFPYVVKLLN